MKNIIKSVFFMSTAKMEDERREGKLVLITNFLENLCLQGQEDEGNLVIID